MKGLLIGLSLLALSGPVGRGLGQGDGVAESLARVRDYHGGAGPWAVVGYRMGARALRELELRRSSHDLMVVHHCPEVIQYACMMDGIHAATGASAGKLNLKHEVCEAAELRTEFVDRKTGRLLVARVRPELARAILDLDPVRRDAEGERVAAMEDDWIFTIERPAARTDSP